MSKTETEALYDDMTGVSPADETPTDEETTEEELLTEEQLEEARTVAQYETEIAALDAKLDEYRTNSINDSKKEAMRELNYTDEQIERYLSFIDGETSDEIKASVLSLSNEISPADNYGDPSAFNGLKQKPAMKDPTELGRKAFNRVKHRVFPGGRA